MEEKTVSLELVINQARRHLKTALYAVMEETHLPPCILDGLICELLADVRGREIVDSRYISERGDDHVEHRNES